MKSTALLVISLCLVNTLAFPTIQQNTQALINPSENIRASLIGNFLQAINQGVSNINKVTELFQIVLGGIINSPRGRFFYLIYL